MSEAPKPKPARKKRRSTRNTPEDILRATSVAASAVLGLYKLAKPHVQRLLKK